MGWGGKPRLGLGGAADPGPRRGRVEPWALPVAGEAGARKPSRGMGRPPSLLPSIVPN